MIRNLLRPFYTPTGAYPPPSTFLPFQRYLLPVVIAGFVLLTLLALNDSLSLSASAEGGIDLHAYWYHGHFVRTGIDPYVAYVGRASLPGPVTFLDGSIVAPDALIQPGLSLAPTNTPPILFLLTPLSYFPWDVAKFIWLLCNVAFAIAIPWLALRLLPPSLQLSLELKWLAAFSFYAMKGPRLTIANGQSSLLVLFLMIVTLLLCETHWLWAGLALGVALGKYSLSLPIVLYLLLNRNFRVLLVAFVVQLVGFIVVTMMEGGSLWGTAQAYWIIVNDHASMAGVQISHFLGAYPQLAMGLVILGTLVTLGAVWLSYRRGWQTIDVVAVNSLLVLWMVLAAYHRAYDIVVTILFTILCLSAATTWQLPARQAKAVGILWLVAVGITALPGKVFYPFLAGSTEEQITFWVDGSVTIALVAMWLINLWLLPLTPRVDA